MINSIVGSNFLIFRLFLFENKLKMRPNTQMATVAITDLVLQSIRFFTIFIRKVEELEEDIILRG